MYARLREIQFRDNLLTPISLKSTFLGCGRKPEHPEKTHASTGRMCKLPQTLIQAGDPTWVPVTDVGMPALDWRKHSKKSDNTRF